MTSKDLIIADQQKSLRAAEMALAECRDVLSSVHGLLGAEKAVEARAAAEAHLKAAGMIK